MANLKFYEAVLRDSLPISREYADKGWPPVLYPFFLALVQMPDADRPAQKAFTLHMRDSIRAGALPAVRQRIAWAINEVIEPHVTAQDFAAWLAREGVTPSPLVAEWLKARGVACAPAGESIEERNARWLLRWDAECPTRSPGSQARAIAAIVAAEGVTPATAKKGLQNANKARAESYRAGGVHPIKQGKNTANDPFNTVKKRSSKSR